MRKFNKIFSAVAMTLACGLTFSSCIQETEPEGSTATKEQVAESSAGLLGALNGIPSQMAQGYLVYGEQVHETDMGYPQFMIAQTELLGDMYPEGSNSGYDWYRNYNTFNRDFGENSYFAYLPWFTLYKFIKTADDVISTVDFENATPTQKGIVGSAYASRAFDYFMLMVLWEPKENVYTDVSKVKGLTVPIVTENTTGDMAKNNPRVSHDTLTAFILSDLDKAEEGLKNYTPANKKVPDLSVVYGLKAKVYLWDQDYANAAKYAELAISTNGGSPMSATELVDLNSGFNTAPASGGWMWYLHYDAENMDNLCNFMGWMSGEADWGYSSLTCPAIDKSLYDRMSATDYRKHQFLDPGKYDYFNYATSRTKDWINDAPDYLALKFRCVGGDYENYATGGAMDVPVMRIEEMYLIDALATGEAQGVSAGVAKLVNFMKSYRDPNYSTRVSALRDFELEVLTQMRLEFWGEGNAFPVAKMLAPDVVQNYDGTNAPANIFKINCKGIKPNWNFVIPISEVEANNALKGMNNPDPTQKVTGPTPIGTLDPGSNK